MAMKILLTTTSFQDTPGKHHDILAASGFEVVRARGPLTEQQVLDLIKSNGGFDGLLNGDDAITAKVIDAALSAKTPLRVIAKYGIGLDSIDVKHATAKKIPVLYTPGVNHTTVAEHTFGLIIALAKHFWPHVRSVKGGGYATPARVRTGTVAWKVLAVPVVTSPPDVTPSPNDGELAIRDTDTPGRSVPTTSAGSICRSPMLNTTTPRLMVTLPYSLNASLPASADQRADR